MPDTPLAATLNRLNDAAGFPDVRFSIATDGMVCVRYGDLERESAFQPVLSVVDGGTIGHVARLRPEGVSVDGASPAGRFSSTAPDALILELDRAFRTLHALNYFTVAKAPWRLFLRVHPRLVEAVSNGHGRVFEGILGLLGVPTHAVVIELPRDVNSDPALLRRALLSYRGRGYKVSSECAGLDDPVLAKRVEVAPDVIVVDQRDFAGEGGLSALVGRIHARGAQALITRIETAEHLAAARGAGADFVQGMHLGTPQRVPQVQHLRDSRTIAPIIAEAAAG